MKNKNTQTFQNHILISIMFRTYHFDKARDGNILKTYYGIKVQG